MRNRLRLGGGPSPDTPAHSSSSSQSPLTNPSSPSSSTPPPPPPPRDRALQRFSDTVTSRSNCGGGQTGDEVKGNEVKTHSTLTLFMNHCAAGMRLCVNGLTKPWKWIRGVSWSERVLYDYNSMRGIPGKNLQRSKSAGIYQTLIIITGQENSPVIAASFVISVQTWFIQRVVAVAYM